MPIDSTAVTFSNWELTKQTKNLNPTNPKHSFYRKQPLIQYLILPGSRPLYIDGRDEGRSNWLRYVNCARDSREENTDTFNCGGRKFYYTTKDVQPDSELLVWYGYFNYTIWNIKSSLINWKFLCWGNQQNKSGSNISVNIKFYQLSYSIHLSSKYLTFCVNHNDSSRMYVLSIDQ